ncbi:MAG: hypothetical protein QOF78_3470 [Phycisphaerales bacterium]|nr:hypothetical protein [Phycisphaerales bacterium]
MVESDAAADAPGAQGEAGDVPADADMPLTRWIVRHRVHIFVFAAVFYLLAFNGEWRVGRDSSLYRGLAHSLATGKGYHFGAFSSRQIYPGLPVLLAGVEKVFGDRAWPAIIIVHLFSLGCLIVTYKLVRLRFPQWVAISITACTALNGWYLELTNEIRDDVPFLFGMLLALYGWERLRIAFGADTPAHFASQATRESSSADERASQATRVNENRELAAPLTILLIGLAIAALMRPTFWILAIAWALVCIWGLIAGPRRKFYAICLAILIVVWVVVMAVDPRVRGFNPLAGGYERDARASIADAGTRVRTNVPRMLSAELAYGFFGQKWIPGATEVINVAVILSSLLLLRRNPLWTLIILLTVAVTLLMTPVPRYYVMVLPLLALSWLMLVIEIARRVPPKHRELAILIGLIMLAAPNVARCIKVVSEQRTHERMVYGPKWKDVAEMSRRVSEIVPEGERVIGPWAPVMSYLSGREVVMSRDIIPRNKRPQIWPLHLEALHIRYAVFPAKLYDDAERQIRFLIDRGVIVPTVRVARVGEEWVLAEIKIVVPPSGKDWRNQPITQATMTHKTTPSGTTRPSNEALARRRKAQAAARRVIAARKAVAMAKQAKLARAERHAAAVRAAAKARRQRRLAPRTTQPTTTTTTTQPAATKTSYRGFDVGGFAGQSLAWRSDSICFSVNFREPRLIPWQRWPAASHCSLLASNPSQNGQVRHCNGRTS